VEEYRFDGAGDVDDPISDVQRINYDTALNGRINVFGKTGNDHFYVDDTTATISLDGGAGFDTFQVGQIFGTKRDEAEGAILPFDVFPDLIATTRGWLSPGTHAPLIAQGGTGNDEFTVYSNQAELRLEGDDESDLFIVRAFALAAVVDTEADGAPGLNLGDILNPILDNNGDGVVNAADANLTPTWEDDVLPLDGNGVATPKIGRGFSVGKPLDIRTGGGEDEVQYNVNSPVSVDGGTGIDKLVVLGTEFADDIVIRESGILGAGLNVRYDNIEIVEVDGLEGDDEFFVQSTAFGVAYRVIGGLGSDTINVTGDVTEDIVTRELEGISGSVDHWVMSDDPGYDGLPVDGIELNLATPDAGQIIISETDGFTAVREEGLPGLFGTTRTVDRYSVKLAPGSYNAAL
jgi:hypothetical protein